MKTSKEPTIRPGQRTPYRRGTQREIDERRGHVGRLLMRGVPKMTIHAVIKQKFGRQWRTTDRDIAMFRWLMRTHTREYRHISPAFLEQLEDIFGKNKPL